jgi:ubiquinone/menaquinone biosynthesis C-methylase UbiE
VEALDISQGMLAQARKKNVYRFLHCLALGEALPFADGHFAGIVSAGVFTSGHVGVEGLPELIRICRSGGVIVLTVKNTLWDSGFSARIAEFEVEGFVVREEETRPYVSMPGEAGTVPSRCLALRRS